MCKFDEFAEYCPLDKINLKSNCRPITYFKTYVNSNTKGSLLSNLKQKKYHVVQHKATFQKNRFHVTSKEV